MNDYNIKAIPTRYSGIMLRARLEARWAAFFDLMGWKWHYEPFDLDGWFPDFLIEGNRQTLVEVKPFSEYDLLTIGRICSAVKKARLDKEVLLLGPGLCEKKAANDYGFVSLGLLGSDDPDYFAPAVLVAAERLCDWPSNKSYSPGLNGDFYHEIDDWGCRVSGFYNGDEIWNHLMLMHTARDYWGKASAAVQYRPRDYRATATEVLANPHTVPRRKKRRKSNVALLERNKQALAEHNQFMGQLSEKEKLLWMEHADKFTKMIMDQDHGEKLDKGKKVK